MKRVFLGGTTAATTWRRGLIDRLLARGVPADRIFDPHLPAGTPWTREHMDREDAIKDDPETIILIHVCRADEKEILGAVSVWEAARYAFSEPERAAIVLDPAGFTARGRASKALLKFNRELQARFGGPPYFASLADAEDWLVERLRA